jgi:hypothetical protein
MISINSGTPNPPIVLNFTFQLNNALKVWPSVHPENVLPMNGEYVPIRAGKSEQSREMAYLVYAPVPI